MSKKSLELEQKGMSSAAVVSEAQDMARRLVSAECRGAGDTDAAMHRIEARYGIPYWTLWGLRYKPPKDVVSSVYLRLRAAYQAECERQAKLFEHERAITRAKTEFAEKLVRAADALVGEKTQ